QRSFACACRKACRSTRARSTRRSSRRSCRRSARRHSRTSRRRPPGAPDERVSSDWSRFYDAAGDEPRETLLEALARFGAEDPSHRLAVDLGCGTGRDTLELLRRGWSVLAVEGPPEGIERLPPPARLPA